MRCWLADKSELRELWSSKEAINRVYRIRGHRRAKLAWTRLTADMPTRSCPKCSHSATPRFTEPWARFN